MRDSYRRAENRLLRVLQTVIELLFLGVVLETYASRESEAAEGDDRENGKASQGIEGPD